MVVGALVTGMCAMGLVLGAGVSAAAQRPCSDLTLYLRGAVPDLDLETSPPGSAAARFIDSPGVSMSDGNPFRAIGAWDALSLPAPCTLAAISALHVWLGLRSGEDRGAKFDVRAEVLKSGEIIGSGIAFCVGGATTGASEAREIAVQIDLFEPTLFDGVSGELSLRLSTRIGTGTGGCSGPASATGVRFYHDSARRASRFGVRLEPPAGSD